MRGKIEAEAVEKLLIQKLTKLLKMKERENLEMMSKIKKTDSENLEKHKCLEPFLSAFHVTRKISRLMFKSVMND